MKKVSIGIVDTGFSTVLGALGASVRPQKTMINNFNEYKVDVMCAKLSVFKHNMKCCFIIDMEVKF